MKTSKAKFNFELMDLALVGVGSVGGGVVKSGAAKFLPDMGDKAGAAINIIGGYFLTRTKNRNLQTLGVGLFSRGFSEGANLMGIGDEAISEGLELSEGLEAELAAELAAEMEAELAADAEFARNDGSI